MQIFSARVNGGVIVPEDRVTLPEGAVVTVVAEYDNAAFELTPDEEDQLADAIREVDAGQVITAEELLERLRR